MQKKKSKSLACNSSIAEDTITWPSQENCISMPGANIKSPQNKKQLKSNITAWADLGLNRYKPAAPTVNDIPSGFYDITYSDTHGPHLRQREIYSDELYELPSPEIRYVLDDIKTFWAKKDVYKKYDLLYKRGILLYGKPGTGKSGIIRLCIQHLVNDLNGIIINIPNADHIHAFQSMAPDIRTAAPNVPIIVIMEDIDELTNEFHSSTTALNLLDGAGQVDNVVYIATTNYPEKLQERITNRPGRFDIRLEVQPPNSEVRKKFIQAKLFEEDLNQINLDEWVQLTEGMTMAHVKELIISVIVMNKDFEDTYKRLTGLEKLPKITKFNSQKIGFK